MNDHKNENDNPIETIYGSTIGFAVVLVVMVALSMGVFHGWQWWMTLPPFFVSLGIFVGIYEYFTKYTIKCPNCEARVNRTAEYCDNCGNKLLKKCPECGNDIAGMGKYCQSCGKLVYDSIESPKKTNMALKLNVSKNKEMNSTQDEKPNLKFCPACGTKTPSYAKHCSACGFTL